LGDCLLWAVFQKIIEIAQIIRLLLSTVQVGYLLYLAEIGWATLWATFSQTHPVTLIVMGAARKI
jgi:hypothetical protein